MNYYIKSDAKHQDLTVIAERVAGVNYKLKQKAELYWITDDRSQDPKTYGYVGVTVKDNTKTRLDLHKKDFVEAGFMPSDQASTLIVETLMTGTYGEMNAQEAVFRPYLGMGWNYVNGGGAVFGMAYLNPKNWTNWFAKTAQGELNL